MRSYIHDATWVTAWAPDAGDLTSFLHAGPLRTVQRYAVEKWGVVRWTKHSNGDWLGWTTPTPRREIGSSGSPP